MCHLHESSGTRNQYISSSSNVTVHVKIYRLGFGHVTSQIANHPVFLSGIETPYGRRTFVYIRIKVHATPDTSSCLTSISITLPLFLCI